MEIKQIVDIMVEIKQESNALQDEYLTFSLSFRLKENQHWKIQSTSQCRIRERQEKQQLLLPTRFQELCRLCF